MNKTHKKNRTKRVWGTLFLGLMVLGTSSLEALEFGHVRARSRGWLDEENGGSSPSDASDRMAMETSPLKEEPEAAYEADYDMAADDPAEEGMEMDEDSLKVSPASSQRRMRLPNVTGVFSGLKKISFKKERFKGYLAYGQPNPLRFADVDAKNTRPPSPALPEFSFGRNDYVPYLIEEPLPEDAMNDPSMLSEVVIELEPHSVVSGKIDTRRVTQEDRVEHFNLEEQRTTVLRPEEVLIFFENNGHTTESGAVIPFSPATPSAETIKSSAKLTKE